MEGRFVKTSFIAGCFDGLHLGHHHILTEASKLGSLTVAINHDHYLARKGPNRPINVAPQRAAALLETGLIEGVYLIDESPLDLIMRLKPSYIVVGDDYTLDRVIGARECSAWGGQVVIIPRIEGYSTTSMIS